jgi:Na+-transporting methylmalonyl-CoA/oxaloacetate decarboxylase gamma subunit
MPLAAPAFLPLPLATLSEFPSVPESIRYQITGLMVVFIALGLIWVLMEILGVFFRRLAATQAAAKAAAKAATQAAIAVQPVSPSVQPAAPAPAIPCETLAIIVAAIHCKLNNRPHRILSIEPADQHDWAREGRRDIFSSHRVR